MKEENITQRDYIIRELPGISPEGFERDLFAKISNLTISDVEDDELNET